MGLTLIRLNDKYDYTGRFQSQLSQYQKQLKSNYEKVCFASGYIFMRMGEKCSKKRRLELPDNVKKNFVEGSENDLNQALGWPSSKKAEPLLTKVWDTLDPIKKGLSTEEGLEEWLNMSHLPLQLMEEGFREILVFIRYTKLHQMAKYYNKPITFNADTNEIYICVNGQPCSSKEILSKFTLEDRVITERASIASYIVEKESGRRFAFLEDGLVEHNSEKDIQFFKVLPVEKRFETPKVDICFRLNGDFDSPEGVKKLDPHAWVRTVDTRGRCRSFGMYAQGMIQCPDPAEFDDKPRKEISVSVANLAPVIDLIIRRRKENFGNYHISKYNCASFVREVCQAINLNVNEKCKVRDFEGFTYQVRRYAISNFLAQALREKAVHDKIVTAKEVSAMVASAQASNSQFSTERSMESLSAKKRFKSSIDMTTYYRTQVWMVQQMLGVTNAGLVMKIIEELDISPLEIKKLCESTLEGSVQTLTYKIFHTMENIHQNYRDYEFCNPSTLYKNLTQLGYTSSK